MEKKSLFRVFKSEDDRVEIIIENVLLMLSRRIYIDGKGEKHPLLMLDANKRTPSLKKKDNRVFTVNTDDGNSYAVRIIFDHISSVGKASEAITFVREYPDHRKIIIAASYVSKVSDNLQKQGVQIFKEQTFAQDLMLYRFQPQLNNESLFTLLSPTEMEGVKKEYNFTNEESPHTKKTDIIGKYYSLKKTELIKVERPSPISGLSVTYRAIN